MAQKKFLLLSSNQLLTSLNHQSFLRISNAKTQTPLFYHQEICSEISCARFPGKSCCFPAETLLVSIWVLGESSAHFDLQVGCLCFLISVVLKDWLLSSDLGSLLWSYFLEF